MKTVLINQTVDVHWRMAKADKSETPSERDEVTRAFPNLIPACEFAVSLAREGDQFIELHPENGPALTLAEAQLIVTKWESGEIADSA
jgi:hypothetical protein